MNDEFAVTDHGSIISIRPLTDTAREWLDENVVSEGWQWLSGALCVDRRYAADLIEAISQNF